MSFHNLFYLLNFIVPFSMYIVCLYFKKVKFNKIGSNGYSTKVSRSSKIRWNYAQKEFPIFFINVTKLVLVLIMILTIIFFIIDLQYNMSVFICFVLSTILYVIAALNFESKLKELN